MFESEETKRKDIEKEEKAGNRCLIQRKQRGKTSKRKKKQEIDA